MVADLHVLELWLNVITYFHYSLGLSLLWKERLQLSGKYIIHACNFMECHYYDSLQYFSDMNKVCKSLVYTP